MSGQVGTTGPATSYVDLVGDGRYKRGYQETTPDRATRPGIIRYLWKLRRGNYLGFLLVIRLFNTIYTNSAGFTEYELYTVYHPKSKTCCNG